jgi:hypothetical protein
MLSTPGTRRAQGAVAFTNVSVGPIQLPQRRLNLQIEKLRIFWRMVCDKKWISLQQLAFVIAKIDETGRMVGGWIKSLPTK